MILLFFLKNIQEDFGNQKENNQNLPNAEYKEVEYNSLADISSASASFYSGSYTPLQEVDNPWVVISATLSVKFSCEQ